MSYLDVIKRGDQRGIRIYSDVDGVLLPFHVSVDNGLGDTERSLTIESDFDPLASYTETIKFFSDTADAVRYISKRGDVDFIYLSAWRSDAVAVLDRLLGIESRGFLEWPNLIQDSLHEHKGYSLRDAESLIDDSGLVVWIDDFAIQDSVVEEIIATHPRKKVLSIQTTADLGLTLDQLQSILDFID